jgi:hypothetical protein
MSASGRASKQTQLSALPFCCPRIRWIRYGYDTIRYGSAQVTGIRYDTGFYKNPYPYPTSVSLLSLMVDVPAAAVLADQALAVEAAADVIEISLAAHANPLLSRFAVPLIDRQS